MTEEKERLVTLQLCPSVAPQLHKSFNPACMILVKVSAYSHTWFYMVIVISVNRVVSPYFDNLPNPTRTKKIQMVASQWFLTIRRARQPCADTLSDIGLVTRANHSKLSSLPIMP